MPLQFVKHNDIDFAQWDKMIPLCYNENPYANSAWLNEVCPTWSALIGGNYEILIPLPIKIKLGFNYLSQPRFTQQLGVFSKQPLDLIYYEEVILFLQKKFNKIYLQFNTENSSYFSALPKRTTYQLSLNESYEKLYSNFSKHHQRNIVKALEYERSGTLVISKSKDPERFIKHFKETVGKKDAALGTSEYNLMRRLLNSPDGNFLCCSSASGSLMAGLFYIKSATKLVNLFNFIVPEGKEFQGMYLLLNHWITEHSSSNLTLDFEGSEIQSIARFYGGFGATPKTYPFLAKKPFFFI